MNLLADLPAGGGAEVFTELLRRPGVRIEHIVSTGQMTPADQPYDQPHDEWVLLLAGAARRGSGWTVMVSVRWCQGTACSSPRMSVTA